MNSRNKIPVGVGVGHGFTVGSTVGYAVASTVGFVVGSCVGSDITVTKMRK